MALSPRQITPSKSKTQIFTRERFTRLNLSQTARALRNLFRSNLEETQLLNFLRTLSVSDEPRISSGPALTLRVRQLRDFYIFRSRFR